ncbi:MAG: hypothetical protein OXT49_10100 [Gammaproteobacteria bacterium]|nr:hypothetical protein [Gammaproteobacteria bacterium]
MVDPLTEGVDGGVNQIPELGNLISLVSTGDTTTGNDVAAGIRNGDNAGNGDVAGIALFSNDNAGGNGVASVTGIGGAGSSENSDANVSIANADNRSSGLLDLGVANGDGATTGNPCPTGDCGRPEPPVDVPNLLVTNGKAEESCGAGSEHNETGLKGAGQLTQFNSRNAREQGCSDTRLQQLSANL